MDKTKDPNLNDASPEVPPSKADYAVGYGKPPVESRFKKGQSGNPRGRRKGSKSFVETLTKVLDQKVSVTIGGQRRSITKFEATLTQMANKAAAGDPKCAQLLIALKRQVAETAIPPAEPIGLNDKRLVEDFLKDLETGKASLVENEEEEDDA